jgi:hypothetical protein
LRASATHPLIGSADQHSTAGRRIRGGNAHYASCVRGDTLGARVDQTGHRCFGESTYVLNEVKHMNRLLVWSGVIGIISRDGSMLRQPAYTGRCTMAGRML